MFNATYYEQQMNLNFPTIADIQTTDLIYFDEAYSGEGYEYCKVRDIDCLPSADDPNTFFLRNDDLSRFEKKEITEDRRLDGAIFLFRPDLLDRFQAHPLQFVFDHGTLTGVVHFSDYNRDFVSTFLYAQFAKYERELRELLISHGLTNDDKIYFFYLNEEDPKKDDRTKDHYRRQRERFKSQGRHPDFKQLPEFQTFYLKDLLGLAKKRSVIRLDFKVCDLRNKIMHAESPVSMEDASTADYIYRFNAFAEFFELVQVLLKDGRRLHNRLVIGRVLNPGATT